MRGLGLWRRLVSHPKAFAAAQRVRKGLVALSAPTPQHRAWRAIDGDHSLRLQYDLGPDSIVLDIGGFAGQWASDIVAMYGCRVHVFEPVPAFAARVEQRFARNPLVTVHPYGLAAVGGFVGLAVSGDASSHVRAEQLGGEVVSVLLRTPAEVLRELGIDSVDLMKLNIEGAEYDLLDHLLDTGIIARIVELQVQFHAFVPDAERRRNELCLRLSATHQRTWCYEFLWENWRRRPVLEAATTSP
jgi:FkbM family methyltransferase